MKYINIFNSMTDFNQDKQTNLNQPRVALVKENGGGVDKLFYIKFKVYTYLESTLINGVEGNYISLEDIPVKTNPQDMPDDETIRGWIGYRLSVVNPIQSYQFGSFYNKLTVTSDSLDLIDNGKLITKFTLTGLKRKDSDERDFVGEIACYLGRDNDVVLLKVNRTIPDHPTVNVLTKDYIYFNKYMDNHEVEKRTKGAYIPFDNL